MLQGDAGAGKVVVGGGGWWRREGGLAQGVVARGGGLEVG